jgi:hypothetical protein
VWFVLLLYILAIAFHAEWRWDLLSGPGIGLLLLAIVGFSTLVIIKQVFWESSWVTAVIMMLLLIFVLDYGITKMMPPDMKGHWTTNLWPSGNDPTKTTGASVTTSDTSWSKWWSAKKKSPCRQETPDSKKPRVVGADWTEINSDPDECELVFALTTGAIVLWGPDDEEEIDASDQTIGRRNYSNYTHVRAKHGTATMFDMTCPWGKSPQNGGWKCRS